MTHPAEIAAARCLAALRALPKPVRAEPGKPVVPQLNFHWDAEQAQVTLDLIDDPGALLSMTATVAGTPRWLTLSVALGNVEFAVGEVIGLAARAELPEDALPESELFEWTLAPLIRSRSGQTAQDTSFGESLAFGPRTPPGVLLRKLRGGDPMVGPPQFHTLILPLPHRSFRLRLNDLRLFVLPANAQAEPDLPRLGSFAI
jgi:hypothetical protein